MKIESKRINLLVKNLSTILAVVVFIGCTHFLWSSLVSLCLTHFYAGRVLNVTKLQNINKDAIDFLGSYSESFALREPNKKSILVVGSSVTYGYPWQENVVFSSLLQKKLNKYIVGNLSVIGTSILGIVDPPFCIRAPENLPDIVIAEIPLVNSVSATAAGNYYNDLACPLERKGQLQTVFSRPWGSEWVRLLWDEESYYKPDSDLMVSVVSKGYFKSSSEFEGLENKYVGELREYFDAISKFGRSVWVYVSPVYIGGIESEALREAVKYQINLSYEMCEKYKKLVCINVSPLNSQRELFYNLTHLNQRGHRAMAQWFEEILVRQGPTPPLPVLPSPSK